MMVSIQAYKVNGKIYECKLEAKKADAEGDIRTSFNKVFLGEASHFDANDFIEMVNNLEQEIKRYYGLGEK